MYLHFERGTSKQGQLKNERIQIVGREWEDFGCSVVRVRGDIQSSPVGGGFSLNSWFSNFGMIKIMICNFASKKLKWFFNMFSFKLEGLIFVACIRP